MMLIYNIEDMKKKSEDVGEKDLETTYLFLKAKGSVFEYQLRKSMTAMVIGTAAFEGFFPSGLVALVHRVQPGPVCG